MNATATATATATGQARPWAEALRSRQGLTALTVLALLTAVCFAVPLLPLDPTAIDLTARSQAPSARHLFGTDDLGRDYLARVLYGGRVSLLVGTLSMAAATVIGTLVGLVAAVGRPWVDNVLMRLVDFLSSIPWMILVIVASVLLRPGLTTIIIVIGGFSWMTTARLVRADVLSIKERAYVAYAGFLGESPGLVVVRHILPAALPTILVAATSSVSAAMLTEASLSFLGLGIQAPMTSWGCLLQTAQGSLQQQPYLALIPGLLIIVTVMSCNALGNTLRRAVLREAA
ncbi:MAG: ABC transporter permease [Propionibacteriaceae bacterium]|jgi:peptide/nickel transport system permease protein|nr:ABC transporter permease [Propionibacteriaceae bacterium]